MDDKKRAALNKMIYLIKNAHELLELMDHDSLALAVLDNPDLRGYYQDGSAAEVKLRRAEEKICRYRKDSMRYRKQARALRREVEQLKDVIREAAPLRWAVSTTREVETEAAEWEKKAFEMVK